MSTERRATLRQQFNLPFRWQALREDDSLESLAERWHLTGAMAIQHRLDELDVELEGALRSIRDGTVTAALRTINARVDVLASSLASGACADGASAMRSPVELSAEGIGFLSDQPLAIGTSLAVHLVLPTGYGLLCCARVTRCDAGAAGERRIGATFEGLSDADSRRLTRLVVYSRE